MGFQHIWLWEVLQEFLTATYVQHSNVFMIWNEAFFRSSMYFDICNMSSWINTNFSIDSKYLRRHKIYCHVLIAFKKWKIANDNTEYLLIYHKLLHLAYLKIFNVCFLSRFRFRFLLMVVVDLISSSSLPKIVLFLGYIKCTRLIYTIGINCSILKNCLIS